jgi:hypothetical protein
MRLIIGTLAAAALIAVSAGAVSADKPEAKCNWGQATAAFVAGSGNNLGDHSSNQDNPRAGLANVIEQDNLHATCEALT